MKSLPILYVDAVPVRVDDRGAVIAVGLLLRAARTAAISRELVSGRVLYHERVRDALLRHLEKDLGPMALPQIPASPQPFTVAEYFPTPGVTPFHDPRQHAVSLAFVVPVAGDCAAAAGRARPHLAHARARRSTRRCRPRWSKATGCCCARRSPTSATPSDVRSRRRVSP